MLAPVPAAKSPARGRTISPMDEQSRPAVNVNEILVRLSHRQPNGQCRTPRAAYQNGHRSYSTRRRGRWRTGHFRTDLVDAVIQLPTASRRSWHCANGPEQFQQKRAAVLRPELRQNKELEHCRRFCFRRKYSSAESGRGSFRSCLLRVLPAQPGPFRVAPPHPEESLRSAVAVHFDRGRLDRAAGPAKRRL